jgi:predicted RNA-binding Zn ribbon-like protein
MELLIGEPLALDLVNTRAHTSGGEFDALDDPADFHAWLERQADRLPLPEARLGVDELAAVRELREHLAVALEEVRHGAPPPPAALRHINEAVRSAPRYPVMEWDGAALIAVMRRDGGAGVRLLARLAEAAVELLTDPAVVRVRGCEGPQCRMLFLPAHPRRRWCSPVLCGNRVRVARYYRRHHG